MNNREDSTPPLRVADIMTKGALSIDSDCPIREAFIQMRSCNIRHFPLVGPEGQLKGIVSDRDILEAVTDTVPDAPISSIATEEVHTIRADEPAADAAQLLLSKKIGSVPVVNADAQLVGLVTETDLVRIAERALRQEPLGAGTTA